MKFFQTTWTCLIIMGTAATITTTTMAFTPLMMIPKTRTKKTATMTKTSSNHKFSKTAFSATASSSSSSSSNSNSDSKSYYTEEQMPFYALGTNFAVQAKDLNLKDVLSNDELDIVLQAFCDTLRGNKYKPSETEEILMMYGNDLNVLLQQRRSDNAQTSKQAGIDFVKEFVAQHSQKDSIVQTDSGLVYLETTPGTGATPTLESTVTVHYSGSLIDGVIIDSSIERGEPFTFPLSGAIKGWMEGLQLMKEGGKATVIFPSDLAYGDEGAGGGVIPPGATLKFDVELLNVETPQAQTQPMAPPQQALQQQQSLENIPEEETELLELPDGTQLRVPKGVKMRLVDPEELEQEEEEAKKKE